MITLSLTPKEATALSVLIGMLQPRELGQLFVRYEEYGLKVKEPMSPTDGRAAVYSVYDRLEALLRKQATS